MPLDEELEKKLITLLGDEKPKVIAVSGAADLGKSHVSKSLVKRLSRQGFRACHLPLDSFLMDRPQRIKRQLSGYQPESYDFSSAQEALVAFRHRKQITYFPYNHQLGRKEAKEKSIGPGSILILEGIHAMHEALMPHIDYSIFIWTEDEQLKGIRYEADIRKRRQSAELSRANAGSEFRHYKREVEPYRSKADCILFLERKWKYVIRDNF